MIDKKLEPTIACIVRHRNELRRKASEFGRVVERLGEDRPCETSLRALDHLVHEVGTDLLPRLERHVEEMTRLCESRLRAGRAEASDLAGAIDRLREQAEGLKGELALARYVAGPADAKMMWDLMAAGRELENHIRSVARREGELAERLGEPKVL